MLSFSVTFKPGASIYEQIIYAVKKAIVTGQLKPGEAFPSVRELSRELKVNPNTALKVINLLVQENILEIHPGIGSVITQLPQANQKQRDQILKTEVERLIIEARRLSIKKKELFDAISENWQIEP
ncbi:MAG: GntR family transcriptional regulator [Candidatus Omnitrophica bacterium]|nr:GntR family transcriptional regulator [Candidatus Omnitrophota bacterium]